MRHRRRGSTATPRVGPELKVAPEDFHRLFSAANFTFVLLVVLEQVSLEEILVS